MNKVYTKDEVYDILNHTFKTFVVVATLDEVSSDGEFEQDKTFLARNGNLASCIGLASEAVRDMQIHRDTIPWESENEN